jgi:hypothetical protein
MVFVVIGGETSYIARCHPRASNVVVSHEKVYKCSLLLHKERSLTF